MNIATSRCHDPSYEQLFDDLIKEVFGFSFSPWFERKLWDNRYESYSIIQDGKMLSNICIFKTDMLVGNKIIRANQFGAVATRERERGRGLSRLLMDFVLSLYPGVPSFLYANPGVSNFYPRFGFRKVPMHRPVISVPTNNSPDKAIKYNPDDKFIINKISGKRVYSAIIDDTNTQPIKRFHLLMDYPDGIYYLPKSGAVVVAEQNKENLFLADIIAATPLSFDEIKTELPFSGVKHVEFGFCPDWLDINPKWECMDEQNEPFFIKGDWDLPAVYRFPSLSVT